MINKQFKFTVTCDSFVSSQKAMLMEDLEIGLADVTWGHRAVESGGHVCSGQTIAAINVGRVKAKVLGWVEFFRLLYIFKQNLKMGLSLEKVINIA